MKIILNWLAFIGFIAAIWALIHFFNWAWLRQFPKLSGLQVIAFSLSVAFTWVEILKLGKHKPFNCLKCMTGWIALLLAWIGHVPYWPLYLFAGVFAGAIWGAVMMRWL